VEQKLEAGKRAWIKHSIDPFQCPYHDMHWAVFDGDASANW